MNPWCRRRQKRLLADISAGRPVSEADQRHLDQCPVCSAWRAQQEQLDSLLAQVRRPEPSPYLAAEVMASIYRKEESRRHAVPVRRRRSFSLGPVLHREAWPIAFAALSMIWGLWISPALAEWEDRPQLNVVPWVESIPERLDQQCAQLQRRLAESLAAIVQPADADGTTEQNQTSELQENWPVTA